VYVYNVIITCLVACLAYIWWLLCM